MSKCGFATLLIPSRGRLAAKSLTTQHVLRKGETLSDFLESTVRQAVKYRRMQAEFDAPADAAWVRFQQTGAAVPAEEIVAEMRARLEARRHELQGKHRPAVV